MFIKPSETPRDEISGFFVTVICNQVCQVCNINPLSSLTQICQHTVLVLQKATVNDFIASNVFSSHSSKCHVFYKQSTIN